MQEQVTHLPSPPSTSWETIARLPQAAVRRRGRFIVVDLMVPHLTISTSARNGGQTDHVRHLVNHQSCEPAGHDARFEVITAHGEDAYHDAVCSEVGLPADQTAVMGTAANMNYAAVIGKRHGDVEVTAIVTAGVESNATCAGDPATWHESADGIGKLQGGTINTILLINMPVSNAAMARLMTLAAEAKSAALQRLAVPSRYSADLATGTGTDQYCLAAPIGGTHRLTSASPHMKFGEIVGLAVRDATLEALRWQNGLEPSYTRGLIHALGRYGISEQVLFDRLATLLGASDFELLKRNFKAVIYEPHVGAAAHAFATVLDRARHGTLPQSCVRDALVQQAALLAANLAAKPELWPKYRGHLQATDGDANGLVMAAIALGWSEKWRTT